jgi:hypothetical protein
MSSPGRGRQSTTPSGPDPGELGRPPKCGCRRSRGAPGQSAIGDSLKSEGDTFVTAGGRRGEVPGTPIGVIDRLSNGEVDASQLNWVGSHVSH